MADKIKSQAAARSNEHGRSLLPLRMHRAGAW
jgi:hypothetical protein